MTAAVRAGFLEEACGSGLQWAPPSGRAGGGILPSLPTHLFTQHSYSFLCAPNSHGLI